MGDNMPKNIDAILTEAAAEADESEVAEAAALALALAAEAAWALADAAAAAEALVPGSALARQHPISHEIQLVHLQ